jgi:hypothetical protein
VSALGDRPTPEERRRFGAVRTPRPLVLWIVRSVDALLRGRLGREGGLAEPGVRVLDPAAGDFNFLRAAWAEAVRKPAGAEGPEALRRHLLADFLGFEIRPGAWAAGQRAAARWLARCGAPLEAGERVPLLLADATRWCAATRRARCFRSGSIPGKGEGPGRTSARASSGAWRSATARSRRRRRCWGPPTPR